MKGVLFIHLRRYLESEHPEIQWNHLLYECGINQILTKYWNYPDRAIDCLVRSSAQKTNHSPGEVYFGFGKRSIYEFRKEYPRFFDECSSSQTFLAQINEIVQNSILNSPGVQPPEFDVAITDATVELTYRSPRRMTGYLRGVIDGLLEMFHEMARVEITDEKDNEATFRITYT